MMLSLLFISILGFFQPNDHPFHVSVCDVKYRDDLKSIQMTHKFFIDDLEDGIMNNQVEKFVIDKKENYEKSKQALEKYFNSLLSIEVNGKQESFIFLGFEIEQESIWCYMEIEKVRNLKSIAIKNRILFETFSDQSNIIHIENEGETKSFRLIEDEDVARVNYN